jgi:hypothetical protein
VAASLYSVQEDGWLVQSRWHIGTQGVFREYFSLFSLISLFGV